jgi:hypothetical protein
VNVKLGKRAGIEVRDELTQYRWQWRVHHAQFARGAQYHHDDVAHGHVVDVVDEDELAA